jgi:hypothetical protein
MPCSYCRNSEHTINRCDSPSIDIHYQRLRDHYEYILSLRLHEDISKRRFINCHLRSGRNYLKAVAIRYAGAVASWNNRCLLEAIWFHFTETGSVPRINPSPENNLNANNLNANNLIIAEINNQINQYIINSMNQEEDHPMSPIINNQFNVLDWTIDRIPSPDGHINTDSPIHYNTHNYNYNYNNNFRHSNYDLVTVVRNLMYDFSNHNSNLISKERRLQIFNITPLLDIETNNSKSCKEDCDIDCAICYEEVKNINKVTLNCGHQFCGDCIDKTIHKFTTQEKPLCALCRTQISTLNIKNQEIYNTLLDKSIPDESIDLNITNQIMV